MMTNPRFSWTAEVKENPHPYICANGCPTGYLWRKEARMCVKEYRTPATFTEAEVTCSKDNGRLASFKTCSEFVGLADHIQKKYPSDTNKYWLGAYILGFERFGSSGLPTVIEGANNNCDEPNEVMYSITGSSNVNPVPISSEGYYGELVYKTDGTPLLMAHEFDKSDTSTPTNFFCEIDESWSCPEESILFHKQCYKHYAEEMTHAEAENLCLINGGKLLEVSDRMEHTFVTAAFPTSEYNHQSIWLNFQKQTNNPNDDLYYAPGQLLHFEFESTSSVDFTSSDQPNVVDENCLILDATDTAYVHSLKKVSCSQNSSFICENPLQLASHYVNIMPEIQVLMPLDAFSGIKDLAYPARQNYESLLAITEDVTIESGVNGYSLFAGDPWSYIEIENTGLNKEMKSTFGISVSMWIFPGGFSMFDGEIQMLIDTRESCDNQDKVSEGFTMFLTKTQLTHTVTPQVYADGCGLVYNNSMTETPATSIDPSHYIRLTVELCSKEDDGSILCSQFSSSEFLNPGVWQHVGFTFDDVSKKGTFFVDETYGYIDLSDASIHKVEYFSFDTNGWWSQYAVNTYLRIGSAKFQADQGQKNFAGRISCMQIYEGPLNLAQFITTKKCPVGDAYPNKASLCPEGFDHYKGYCYKYSENKDDFSAAEAFCTSPPGKITFMNRLLYT